jgi:hypothetical protein
MMEISPIAQLGLISRARVVASKEKNHAAGEAWLAINGAPERVVQNFKAAVGGSTTGSWNIGTLATSIGAWSDNLRTTSVYWRIFADGGFTRLPLNSRIGMAAAAPIGGTVAEGAATPIARLDLTNLTLTPIKACAKGLVFTNETLMAVGPAGQNFINRELMSELSNAVDAAFLGVIASTAGIVSNPAAGVTAIDCHHDLKTALLAVGVGARSKYYWLASPDVCKKVSALPDSTGGSAFPAMSATDGGELLNLPCLVSTGVPAASLYLIDASAIGTDAMEVGVDVSTHADVQMDSSPTMSSATPTATTTVSMFGTNSTILRAFTWMGVTALRSNCAAIITSINWG